MDSDIPAPGSPDPSSDGIGLETLRARLELASFQERQTLVTQVAQSATESELNGVGRMLNDRSETVRLGAIEILEAARFRPALPVFVAITRKRQGQERTYAARAIATMAIPDDRDNLSRLADTWIASGDEFLAIHARTLHAKLGLATSAASSEDRINEVAPDHVGPDRTSTAARQASQSSSPPGIRHARGATVVGITAPEREVRHRAIAQLLSGAMDPATALVEGLLESRHAGVRVDLLVALEGLGAAAVANAATPILTRGDSAAIAVVVQTLKRHINALPAERRTLLEQQLEQARRNHRSDAVTTGAIDECLVALRSEKSLDRLLSQADTMSVTATRALALRLDTSAKQDIPVFIAALLPAIKRSPRRALLFAEFLRNSQPHLRPAQREQVHALVREACERPIPEDLPGELIAAIGLLYATTIERGDTPHTHILEALAVHSAPACAQAAIEILRASSTEDSARQLCAFVDEPDADVRRSARHALETLDPMHARIAIDEDGAISVVADYRVPPYQGNPNQGNNARGSDDQQAGDSGDPHRTDDNAITASDGQLIAKDGTHYALDEHNQLVPQGDTSWGACRCCTRPRVLVRTDHARPLCPITGERHLVLDEGTAIEREHPLGGCSVCESPHPLQRHGNTVLCDTCQTEHVFRRGSWRRKIDRGRRRRRPNEYGEYGQDDGDRPDSAPPSRDLPPPPDPEDLRGVAPAIVQAIAANVFIIGMSNRGDWSGSGVIVARHGREVAILTNRHVVEDDGPRGPVVASLRVATVAGSLVPATVQWRAQSPLDLALITVKLPNPDDVAVVDLEQDANYSIGSPLFAIGNPTGMSWSYTSGKLSAIRKFRAEGIDIQLIQSHVPLSPGSSGGGMYHEDGHLVGINTFINGDGKQSFSIAIPTVIAALKRERVAFAGERLFGR